jgi:Ca2+/Na+ antiporter
MRYFGGAILVIGIVLIAVRCKFPIIPIHLGIGVAIGGMVLAILPEIIDVTKTIIYIVFGVGLLMCVAYLIMSYWKHNRSESTLSIMVDSIRNLEDSDDPNKKNAATEIKNIFSSRMDVLNKNEIDRLKTKMRVIR